MADLVVSATVITTNADHVARATEAFGRAAAGLALEGMSVSVTVATLDDDDDGLA